MASKVDDATSLIKQETDDEAEDDEPREAKRRKTEEAEASAIHVSDQKQVPPKGDAPVVKVEEDGAYDKETDDEKEEESHQEVIKPLQEEESFREDLAKWTERVKKCVTKYAKAGGGRALAVAILSKERFDFHMKSEGNDDELAEGLNMFSYEPYGNGQGLELSEKRGVDDLGDCRSNALSLLKTETQNDSEDIKYTSDLSLYLIPGTAGEDWTDWSNGDWDLVVKEAESEIGPFPGPFTVSRLATIVKELEGIVFPSA